MANGKGCVLAQAKSNASAAAAPVRKPEESSTSAALAIGGNQEFLHSVRIRVKLAVSRPSDPAEVEADRAADAFSAATSQAHGCPEVGGCEGHLMRKTDATPPGPQAAASRMQPFGESGRPLPRQAQQQFEGFFGSDLSHVRVHENAAAARAAQTLDAHAFVLGSDIAFAAGRYDAESPAGRKLLAHELTHVVQQNGGAAGSHRISSAPFAYARQPGPQSNPALTPDEMFEIVVRERAWTFSPGGGAVDVDPQGVGRGVGPAAGGKVAGHSVFAVIQVTDDDGRPIALTYGEHISYSDPHAESRAVTALQREIPAMRDVSGGKMTVVVDQIPCPPGRADCMGRLQAFARERGLQLDVQVPTRERMHGGGQVAPRTAAMSSQRTDVPPVSLRQYDPTGKAPPTGGAPPVSTPSTPPAKAPRPTGGMRFAPPKPASPDAFKVRASLMAKMSAQAQRGVRLNARIKMISTGMSGVFGFLSTLDAIEAGFTFAQHQTLFPEAEAMLDQINDRGKEMVEWANEVGDEISFLEAFNAINDAEARDDVDALFDLDESFSGVSQQLREKADYFRDFAKDLRARAKVAAIMADYYGALKHWPSYETGSTFQAFAMEESLKRLNGQFSNAASHFEEAEGVVRYYGDSLSDLSHIANDKGWSITWVRVVVAQAEYDREQRLGTALGRERRLNQVNAQIESVEAQLDEPVSRLPEDSEALWQRRDQLIREREELRGATASP